MLLTLPEDVLRIIMSFQAHKDRISMATTCSDLLKAVESFSERALVKIRQNDADDTFMAQISDQSSIVKEMQKPSSISAPIPSLESTSFVPVRVEYQLASKRRE